MCRVGRISDRQNTGENEAPLPARPSGGRAYKQGPSAPTNCGDVSDRLYIALQ